MLEIYREYLLGTGVTPAQVIWVNLEDMRNQALLDPHALHAYILDTMDQDAMTYVFIDEIQQVPDFQRVLASLQLNESLDLYITGSNAYLLSGELATLLSGRYIEIEVLPLSFAEYVSFLGEGDLQRKYADYLSFSSFPYTLLLRGKNDTIRDYLQGIYSTVILKDVIERTRISDPMILESVVRFLFDTIGNPVSMKKISDTLTSAGRRTSAPTVEKYVTALLNSFLFYRVHRYDIQGKQYLKTLEKYYASDLGLRFLLLGDTRRDLGHMLENIIYLELRRRGYRVFVGKSGDKEIDFIAQDQYGTRYYQVSLTIRDESVLNRELAPLLSVNDHYPKYILTMDDDPLTAIQGITCMNALDFLLGKER